MSTPIEPISGNMQNNLPLPYNFNISILFSEAWQKVSGTKATYWGAIFLYFAIYISILIVLSIIAAIAVYAANGAFDIHDPTFNNYFSSASNFLSLALYPMLVGIYCLGIRRAGDLPIEATMIMRPFQRFFRIMGTLILTYLAIMVTIFIGFFIFGLLNAAAQSHAMYWLSYIAALIAVVTVAAAIFVCFSLMFAPMLVFEKRMGIFKAMRASFSGFSQHWFKIIVLQIAMIVIIAISAIPVFIGYIWTVPMALNLFGALYRTIFGVEKI